MIRIMSAVGILALVWIVLGAPTGSIRFENRYSQSGVRFVLNNSTTPDKPIIDSVLGGVAVFDFDNDGYLDLFFTNGAKIPSLIKDNESFHNRLYRNNHDGTFTDVTARAGLAGEGYSMGVAAADFDNDGLTDLYVTGVNRNFLYHNRGDGTFADVTERAGVGGRDASGKKLWSVSAAWIDFDNDGRLDLFVTNYLHWSFSNNQVCGPVRQRLTCPPATYKGLPNFLYHNNGDGTFTDVSQSSGIGAHVGKGMGVAIADYDGNGFMDILVGNDNERNFLFRNDHGRFTEVGVESAVAYNEDGIPVSSMGVDFRDLNDDGRPDIVITALGGESFPLFINSGNGYFTASNYQVGIGFLTRRLSGWGVGAFDFDNDGHKDLFTANSHVSENAGMLDALNPYRQWNAVFRNDSRGHFRSVSREAGLGALPAAAHRGSAFGDLNNDGKIDVVVSAVGQPAEILYNTSSDSNHWILIQTEGTASNRDGIGTRIKLTGQSGRVQYNHVTTSVGYASSSDKRVHFGLGADTMAREIELRWPSGRTQVLRNVKADQILKVREE
jgi:enediyne biosynthesis protein E4